MKSYPGFDKPKYGMWNIPIKPLYIMKCKHLILNYLLLKITVTGNEELGIPMHYVNCKLVTLITMLNHFRTDLLPQENLRVVGFQT